MEMINENIPYDLTFKTILESLLAIGLLATTSGPVLQPTIEYTPHVPRITQEMRNMSKDDVKRLISDVFGTSAPYALAIASCESGIQQFKDNGHILRGIVNNRDIGIFQINSDHHEENYLKMDIDVFTPYGNVLYAKYLYDKNGMRDWNASKPCWSKQLYGNT